MSLSVRYCAGMMFNSATRQISPINFAQGDELHVAGGNGLSELGRLTFLRVLKLAFDRWRSPAVGSIAKIDRVIFDTAVGSILTGLVYNPFTPVQLAEINHQFVGIFRPGWSSTESANKCSGGCRWRGWVLPLPS